MEKSLSEQIEIEITKLFYLSLLINRYSNRCVFFNMNGHVSTLEISIRHSKKEYSHMPIDSEICYNNSGECDWYKDDKKRLDWIKGRVEFLETICKEDKIPFEYTNKVMGVIGYEF